MDKQHRHKDAVFVIIDGVAVATAIPVLDDDQNSSVRLAEKECLVVGNFEHRVPHDVEGLQFAGRNRHVRLTKRLVDLRKRFMQDRSDFLPVSYVIGHKYRLLSFTKLH